MKIQNLKLFQEIPKWNIRVSNGINKDIYIPYQERCSVIWYLDNIPYLEDIESIDALEIYFESWTWKSQESFSFIKVLETSKISFSKIKFYCNWQDLNFEGECYADFWNKNTHIDSLEINANWKLNLPEEIKRKLPHRHNREKNKVFETGNLKRKTIQRQYFGTNLWKFRKRRPLIDEIDHSDCRG